MPSSRLSGGTLLWYVMSRPKFLYFDLGKVLVNFEVEVMCRQIAELAGIAPPVAKEIIFGGDLQRQCELGRLSRQQFHEIFCKQAGCQVDSRLLEHAASTIFELNVSIVPLIGQLSQTGNRLGILSNTSPIHWEYCRNRFRLLTESFQVYVLSYRIGAMKPDPVIYRAAAEMAGVAPGEIFYTDDIAGHVAGARAAGLDAVQYTSTPQLVEELRSRGVEFNY